MGGINGFNSLLIQRVLGSNSLSMFTALQRLATGRRINSGADDPAGLIFSQNLRSKMSTLEAEIRSFERADYTANVADGGLDVASSLLSEANGLVVANAGGMLSDEEKQANQLALDSIMSTINRITGGTEFNGEKLLDGTATIAAGDAEISLDEVSTSSIGEITVDTETYTLSDLEAGGALNIVDGDLEAAQDSIEQAITDVSTMRGELGAFQRHSVQSQLNSKRVALENTQSAFSAVADADFALEIVNFHRSQLQFEASLMALTFTQQARASILRIFDNDR